MMREVSQLAALGLLTEFVAEEGSKSQQSTNVICVSANAGSSDMAWAVETSRSRSQQVRSLVVGMVSIARPAY